MDRKVARGQASTSGSVVWLAGLVSVALTAGCVTEGQHTGDAGPGPLTARAPATAAVLPPAAEVGDTKPPASRSPTTLGEAVRAYREQLQRPLSERGPGLNSGGRGEDVGRSQFPPAEGQRGGERGSTGGDGGTGGTGDVGMSRYPSVAGERDSAGNRADPATAADPDGLSRGGERDIGKSQFPPAEGERGKPVSEGSFPGPGESSWFSAHEQATVVSQAHNVFHSPYMGQNSLRPHENPATSMTGTMYLAARLFESQHNDTELIFNPEIAGGTGFSHTMGIAGFPNGEITRVGIADPTPYIARLYLRQTFGLGGERTEVSNGLNEVAGQLDERRWVITMGKMAAPDVADDNRYAHDPRTQFLNWALVYNGAWDYPANVRGYTYGVAIDYITKNWDLTYGIFTEPAIANGAPFDWHIDKAQGQVLEFEEFYKLSGRPGTVRLMAFLNRAHMGNYDEALTLMPVNPDITKTRSYRFKYGFCLSLDQALTDDLGFLCRLGWNDGHSESWAYTEIDQTASVGLVLGGRAWARPYDRVGLAGILNGISGPHRRYLAAGGYGFIIGDGRLNYSPEEILELYYALQIRPGIVATIDFQEVGDPAYNRDRGPVSIVALRVHFDH